MNLALVVVLAETQTDPCEHAQKSAVHILTWLQVYNEILKTSLNHFLSELTQWLAILEGASPHYTDVDYLLIVADRNTLRSLCHDWLSSAQEMSNPSPTTHRFIIL